MNFSKAFAFLIALTLSYAGASGSRTNDDQDR